MTEIDATTATGTGEPSERSSDLTGETVQSVTCQETPAGMIEARPGTFTIPKPREIWRLLGKYTDRVPTDRYMANTPFADLPLNYDPVLRHELVYFPADVQALVEETRKWHECYDERGDEMSVILDAKEAELAAAKARIAELERAAIRPIR